MKKQIVEINGKYAARYWDESCSVWSYLDKDNPVKFNDWITVSSIGKYCLVNSESDAEKLIKIFEAGLDRNRRGTLSNPKIIKEFSDD